MFLSVIKVKHCGFGYLKSNKHNMTSRNLTLGLICLLFFRKRYFGKHSLFLRNLDRLAASSPISLEPLFFPEWNEK